MFKFSLHKLFLATFFVLLPKMFFAQIIFTESQIKAAYIYNFAKEITWPDEQQIDTFKIVIFSLNPDIYEYLKAAAKNKTVHGHPIKVYNDVDLKHVLDLNPQIIYVDPTFNPQIKQIYQNLKNRNILLVTDNLETSTYTMINFLNYGNKIIFKINMQNLTDQHLTVSEDIKVYGGTVYDIIPIFNDKERELKNMQKRLDIEKRKLDSLSRLYVRQESIFRKQMDQLHEKLELKQDSVEETSNKLDSLRNVLMVQEDKLAARSREIDQKRAVVYKLQKEIITKRKLYDSLVSEVLQNQKIIENQKNYISRYEREVRHQSRQIFWLNAFVTLLLLTLVIIFYFFFQNRKMANDLKKKNKEIEAQTEEQKQLIKELEKLSLVVRETDNVVFILDARGTIQWINDAFQKRYGLKVDDYVGKNIRELGTMNNEQLIDSWDKCVNNKISVEYESEIHLKDGRKVCVQVSLTPILNYAKEVEQVIAINTDISKLKKIQNEMERVNKLLVEQQKVLWKQKREIEEKNKLINSSLEYAKTIQNAILPPHNEIVKYFKEYFIIYRPMQIVSGDFYWLDSIDAGGKQYTFVVVADGTGHGVPGAFISLISERLIDEAIFMRNLYQPKDILHYMDNEINRLITKDDSWEVPITGVDLILMRIEKIEDNNYEIVFAGAKRPLVYYIPGARDLEYFRTTRRSISSMMFDEYKQIEFEEYTVNVPKNTIFYLYTDGYVDQICHAYKKRIGTNRFLALIRQNVDRPLQEQRQILEKYLDSCLVGEVQRDDITIFTFRI